ncbi:MAG: 4Fe-4S dicluster domain-containing protein [Ectothiorhodospiraceae bacterium AqS1]|nr:4Fe-4S dicluster domain-containing protein [Ectothiorhodospiraceae bacterium AqS1]
MHKSLLIDPHKCTGCLQCELACSFEHTGAFNPARSRIKVFEFEHGALSAPYTCTQCEEAWCMHACPVDAIAINFATGAKEVDIDLCVGCKVCTTACPYGTVNYHADSGKVVKCDLCGGRPQCSEACPTGAIIYAQAETPSMSAAVA